MLKPKKQIKNLDTYSIASYPENWDMKLDSNENYIGPSTSVLNAIKNTISEDISHYPCYGELLDLISAKKNVDKDEIIITNGADEALSAIINTYVTTKDKVISVTPSFVMPKIYSHAQGAQYIEIEYKEKWIYPYDDVVKAIDDKTKLVILTTPNNPTGDIIPLEQITQLLEMYPDVGFIIDETYSNYAGISYDCLVKYYANAIVVKSMSKDYGLAGLRIGYITSQRENIENIQKVLSPYNVNSIAVIAAICSLNDENYLAYVKNEINESKVYLSIELEKLGFNIYESYANFILVDFLDKTEMVYEKLLANKIIVKRFNTDLLKTCLRITVPTNTAAKRIVSCLKSKDTIVFDMDGVLIDVSQSYFAAIKYTYNYFTGKNISDTEIHDARKLGGLNNDWDITKYLIDKSGFKFPYEKIVEVFQKQYWDDGNGSINSEDLIINPDILKQLSLKYNLAVFTGRPDAEAKYTLSKFGIMKYFDKIVTMDDVGVDKQKPNTEGLKQIALSLFTDFLIYFGDTVDDVSCACSYGAKAIGVLPPSDKSESLKEILYANGAKKVVNNINELYEVLEKCDYETSSNQ